MKNLWFYGSCIGLVLGTVIALVVMNNLRRQKPRVAENQDNEDAQVVKEDKPPGKDWIKVGDVWRPKSDVFLSKEQLQKRARDRELARKSRSSLPDPGKTPKIKKDLNPNTKSVAEAFQQSPASKKEKDLSYRLSSFVKAPDFDREKYLADKQAYLDEVAPGRVWQELPRGPGVARIQRTSSYYKEVLQGETVILRAKTEPLMPVSFLSTRLGQFDSSLPSITVAANDEGIAEARFTASSGTHGEIDIIATSPVRSGRAKYLVKVVLPDQPAVKGPKG